MLNICDKSECTGCAACFNVCAKGAVEFLKDDYGVKRAYINENLCVNCGLCKKVCPAINAPVFNSPKSAIAAYTKDKNDKKTVSSGGLATTIYKKIIGDGGVGYGVTANIDKAEFIRIDNVRDAERLKGSKYVESIIGDTYKKLKQDLINGKKCVFIGTPCQVAGLKNYLGRDYGKLVTIDFVCHGTPSAESFSEYLKHITKNKQFDRFSFRGQNDYCLTIYNKDRVVYKKKEDEDAYFYSFLKNLAFKENCYSCRYARRERVSDLTIGDFWGIGKDALDGYKGKISLTLINTEKGAELFKEISPLLRYEERDIEEAINGNAQLRSPSAKSPLRNDFLKLYKSHGFVYALNVIGIAKKCRRNSIENKVKYLPRKLKKIAKRLFNK